MVEFEIPGSPALVLDNLILDYNGTLAVGGVLLSGVADRLESLAEVLTIHVVTADTFGVAADSLAGLPCTLSILPSGDQAERKKIYCTELGAERTVAVGNGRNDQLMLSAARLGIAVILGEGAYAGTISAADIVCTNVNDALDLLLDPKRIIATLRS